MKQRLLDLDPTKQRLSTPLPLNLFFSSCQRAIDSMLSSTRSAAALALRGKLFNGSEFPLKACHIANEQIHSEACVVSNPVSINRRNLIFVIKTCYPCSIAA